MKIWTGANVLHVVLIFAAVLGRGNLEAEAQDAHQPDFHNTSDSHDIQGHQQHLHQSNNQSVNSFNHTQHNHSHFTPDEEQQGHLSVEEEHSHSATEGNHSHSAVEHDHSACGHNTAVAPWMHQQLLMFDTAKEAADAIAKTSVKAATGDHMPPVPAEIRIHTDFQLNGIEDVSKRHFLKHQLVPRMVAEIRRRIHVKAPVQGNMKIPRYCAMYYVRDDGSYACAKIADQDYCSSPEIGIRHNMDYLDGFTLCENTDEGSCDAYSGGAGVADSDFVLYVAANEVGYCEHGHIVAFAGTCALDMVSNRPLAGFANFCPRNIDTDPAKFQDLLETAIHEALHALFFSELLFPYFIDSLGQRRTDVVKVGTDGRKMVVTPAVKQAARDHFGCDTLEGALLENEGGDGTAGNHWESKVFKGELMDGMSGAPNERAVFSAITLALIDDTGWYNANWNLQGRLGFGRDAGCSFVSRDCSSRNHLTTAGPQWFCPTGSRQDACSWDLKSVGQCSSEQLLDGCSTTVAYRNMHCQKAALQAERDDSNSWLWGYEYGPNSRCMREIGPLAKLPGDGYKYTKFAGQSNLDCYKFTCQDGLNLHLVVGEHEVLCPSGQDVDLRPLGYVSGILGPCPDNKELCSQLSCPNLCSGNGDCSEGKCYCALGFAGDDCSQTTCLRNSCPAGLVCNTKAGVCESSASKGIKTKEDCPAAVFEAADWEAVYLLMGISSEDFSHCYSASFNRSTTMKGLPPSMELEPPPIDLGSSYGAEWGDEEPLPDLNIGQGGSMPPTTNGSGEKPQLKPSPSHSMPSPPPSPSPLPGASPPLQDLPSGVDTAPPETETAGPPSIPSLNEDPSPSKEDHPEKNAPSSTSDSQAGGKPAVPGEANQGSDIPDRMPVLPSGEVISERADAQLQLVQLDGDRPMSTLQAENLKLVLARAAGVGTENIIFTELQLPTMADDPYILDVRIDSSDAARVTTSLRNADLYGILRPKIREEVKMECKSLAFDIQDESDGGALGWAIGIGILTAALLGGLVSCLLLCGPSCCSGSSPHKRNVHSRGKASSMKGQKASAGQESREAVPSSNRRILQPMALEEQGRSQHLKHSAAAAAMTAGSHLRGEPSLTNDDLNHERLEPSSAQIEDDSTTLRSKYQRDFDPGEARPQHDPDEISSRHREKPPSSSTPCAAGTGKSHHQGHQRHHHQGHSSTARVGEKPRSPSSVAKGSHARSPATL